MSASLGSIYFKFITKEWSYLVVYAIGAAVISLAIVIWSVENPIFLVSQGKSELA